MSSRFTPESRPWSQTAALLALAFCCYVMPWPASAGEANLLLRIQGSNTIGAKLEDAQPDCKVVDRDDLRRGCEPVAPDP